MIYKYQNQDEEPIGFKENGSYIEEGQFWNDEMNGTFGRKIYYQGTTKIGWFLCNELNGYGKDLKKSSEGYFEMGTKFYSY